MNDLRDPATEASTLTATKDMRSLNDYFIENRGQVTDGIRYYLRGNPSVAFRNDGVMFVVHEVGTQGVGERRGWSDHASRVAPAMEDKHVRSVAYLLRFEDANKVEPVGGDRLPFSSNFLIGSDPGGWRTDVPSFREVVYNELYSGIDLVYRPSENGVKYELHVKSGADLGTVRMTYEGVESLRINEQRMAVMTAIGEIRDSPPYSYQDSGKQVGCAFALRDSLSYGFDCDGWDRSSSLIIDPLIYSTFIGGNQWDRGYSIKVDSNGSAYVTGTTLSTDFPTTPGSYDTTYGGLSDAFVTKLNRTGSALVYSTYIGGSRQDDGLSIALDSNGDAYLAGHTLSTNFPVTPGANDTTYNGNFDAFVTKLDARGRTLLFSTYIGGAENDTWPSVVVDSADNVYVAGITESPDFPVTPLAFDRLFGGGNSDAFALKLDASGTSLLFSTFLGGTDDDFAYSIAVDTAMNAYVTGGTWSTDFPATPGAFDTSSGGSSDVFLTKVNATGRAIDYSTYLGGGAYDVGLCIAVDRSGFAYVTGATNSSNFPTTPGAFDRTQNSPGWNDPFVAKLNDAGSRLIYSTYLGGNGDDYGNAITLGELGNAYLTGATTSADFPVTPGAFDNSYNGAMDAFVTELNTTGFPANSTYLGGSGSEGYLSFLAIDTAGAAYVTGITNSSDFPVTPGAFDPTLNLVRDCFVTKLGPALPDLAVDATEVTFNPPEPVTEGTLVTIDATIHNIGTSNASNVVVRFYDGPPSGSNQIGADQIIPLIRHSGGTGLAATTWSARPPGMLDICAVADPDNTIRESSEKNNMACKRMLVTALYAVSLAPGHRFMSFPLLPVDDSIESVLSSISGCYDYVRWYDVLDAADHWKSYVPGRGYNDLSRLDNTMGFWINITSSCNFILVGVRPASTSVNLHQGWNMVGSPSFNTSYTVADLKADLGLAGIVVEAFDSAAAPYYLQRAPDSCVMMAGEGYWVYVPSDTVWVVYG